MFEYIRANLYARVFMFESEQCDIASKLLQKVMGLFKILNTMVKL